MKKQIINVISAILMFLGMVLLVNSLFLLSKDTMTEALIYQVSGLLCMILVFILQYMIFERKKEVNKNL